MSTGDAIGAESGDQSRHSTRVAVVVLAHGSRSEESTAAHLDLCARLGTATGRRTYAAFLELATPSLDEAVGAAVQSGATRVVVMPYFLAPGRHVRRDVPALVDAARAAYPDVEIVVGDVFGADPRVVDVLTSQIEDALRRS